MGTPPNSPDTVNDFCILHSLCQLKNGPHFPFFAPMSARASKEPNLVDCHRMVYVYGQTSQAFLLRPTRLRKNSEKIKFIALVNRI
jgi:hypothetical protein